jgi:hypothetical protein
MKNCLKEIKFFEVLPGNHIKEASEAAINIAKSLNVIVKFAFNGKEITVYEFTTIEDVVHQYNYKYEGYIPIFSFLILSACMPIASIIAHARCNPYFPNNKSKSSLTKDVE